MKVFSEGRFQLRSWMFIYLGLIAAYVLAGPTGNSGAAETNLTRSPAVAVDSPLLRRDI